MPVQKPIHVLSSGPVRICRVLSLLGISFGGLIQVLMNDEARAFLLFHMATAQVSAQPTSTLSDDLQRWAHTAVLMVKTDH
jgi:hypothetical protein